MSRKYTPMKQYYEEMERLHQEEYSSREIGEKFGFTKEQVKECPRRPRREYPRSESTGSKKRRGRPANVPFVNKFSKNTALFLLCTAGRGWYQEWSKPARELFAGDVVQIPVNVKHWHGAAKDSWFAHLSIGVPGEATKNEWLEPVSDEEYGALK